MLTVIIAVSVRRLSARRALKFVSTFASEPALHKSAYLELGIVYVFTRVDIQA
jgi:hypothetical protein